MRIVLAMREAGDALLVIGNHDYKFLRWLRGRPVRVSHGLGATIAQLSALPEPDRAALLREVEALLASAPGYLLLDGARLVVTHGAIHDDMLGLWNDRIASLCLYGDVIGVTADGRPTAATGAPCAISPQPAARRRHASCMPPGRAGAGLGQPHADLDTAVSIAAA